MNRIITILVTIFILLLLYIWISHVWGSDKPRHPRQITDARETGINDGDDSDVDTTYSTTPVNGISPYDTMAQVPVDADEYATERKVNTDAEADAKNEEEAKAKAEEKARLMREAEAKTKAEAKANAEEKTKTVAKAEEKKPEPKKTTTTTSKPAATTPKTETKPVSKPVTSSGGQHLVIAGNFTQLVNAEQQVQKLKKAGFNDAEVVNFDLSEYHTVCAGRFADVNEARKLVKKLKDYHKIDAYVRIGG